MGLYNLHGYSCCPNPQFYSWIEIRPEHTNHLPRFLYLFPNPNFGEISVAVVFED